jgi:Right handed beta helix region
VVRQTTIEDNRIVGWSKNVNGLMLGRGINVSVVGPGITLSGNYIENTSSAGPMISGCTPAWCSGNPDWPATGVSATDNTIVNAGQLYAGSTVGQGAQPGYGIYVAHSAAPITVSGNTIVNAYRGDVAVAGCTGGCQIQSS